jgi:hypothetical protein
MFSTQKALDKGLKINRPAVELFPVTGETEPRFAGEGHHDHRAALRAGMLPEPVPVVAVPTHVRHPAARRDFDFLSQHDHS